MRRIKRELDSLASDEFHAMFTVVQKDSENYRDLIACITPPENSPYSEGLFLINILIPEDYPFKPPKVKFLTPIYHVCIDKSGVDLGILHSNWSPACTVQTVLIEIINLISDFSPDDPQVPSLARQYISDRSGYNKEARNWTRKYAI